MISSIDPAPSVISCGGQSALFLSACPQGFQKIFQQGAKGPQKIAALLRQPATPPARSDTPRDPLSASPSPQLHCVAYGLTECRSSGLTADSSILVQPHRQKFLEGRGAGRENLFPKRFPSPQAFLSSNLQASACRPCRTMFFLRGDSLARSPTRHCSPAGERVSGTGTNIDDNSARPFPKTKKSPTERGQKKTPSRCELQGGLEQSLAAAYFPT